MLAEPFDLSQMKKELTKKTTTKDENYSTPSVTAKPPVQPALEKSKHFFAYKIFTKHIC